MMDRYLVVEMGKKVVEINPDYPLTPEMDYKALYKAAEFINSQLKLRRGPDNNAYEIIPVWEQLYQTAYNDPFYRDKSLNTISTHLPEFFLKLIKNDKQHSSAQLGKKLTARYGKR